MRRHRGRSGERKHGVGANTGLGSSLLDTSIVIAGALQRVVVDSGDAACGGGIRQGGGRALGVVLGGHQRLGAARVDGAAFERGPPQPDPVMGT